MVRQAFDDAIDQVVLDQILKVENRLDLKNRKIPVIKCIARKSVTYVEAVSMIDLNMAKFCDLLQFQSIILLYFHIYLVTFRLLTLLPLADLKDQIRLKWISWVPFNNSETLTGCESE